MEIWVFRHDGKNYFELKEGYEAADEPLEGIMRSIKPLTTAAKEEGGEIKSETNQGSAQQDMPNSKTVSFPAANPLLSISIPDGWTTPGASVAGAEFPLLIMPPKGINGKVSLYVKDKVTDPQA